MANLDDILKNRVNTLPTIVHFIKQPYSDTDCKSVRILFTELFGDVYLTPITRLHRLFNLSSLDSEFLTVMYWRYI